MWDLLDRLVRGLLVHHDGDALSCPACHVRHSRAGEAAFPLISLGIHHREQPLIDAGLLLADWLVDRQNPDGSWDESPDGWAGTTVFQLMALAALCDQAEPWIDTNRRARYLDAVRKAASWVTDQIRFRMVTTNYVAAGAGALALVHRLIPEPRWEHGARRLSRLAVGRINRDGLVEGEGIGRRIARIIYLKPNGIDIGYGLEMTLGSLALYAAIMRDEEIGTRVDRAIEAHLYFLYPDGSLDNSMGSRGYKWTIYGSKTAHGSQMAWAYGASRFPAMATAERLATGFLSRCVVNGLLSNGPSRSESEEPPCLYPTVVRAVNLSLALSYFPHPIAQETLIPCRQDAWVKRWPTLESVQVRRAPWMATISGYRSHSNHDVDGGERRFVAPGGGSTTYLYHDGWGPVQAATQLDYWNWEALHLPPRPEAIVSLTPRIEVQIGGRRIVSAAGQAVQIAIKRGESGTEVVVSGRLAVQRRLVFDGIGSYSIAYTFLRTRISKRYSLRLQQDADSVEVIEPILIPTGAEYRRTTPTLHVQDGNQTLVVTMHSDQKHAWETMESGKLIYCPLPALTAYPLALRIMRPQAGEYCLELSFEVRDAERGLG